MGIVTQKIILDSNPKKVWGFITNPDNFPKYVYGYASGKTTSKNKVGLGARYEWYGKWWWFKLKSVEEIIKWDAGKQVAYSGKLFGIKFDSSMEIKEINKQRTLLTVSIKYKVPFFFGGKIADLFCVRMTIKTDIQQSLNLLKSKMQVKHQST